MNDNDPLRIYAQNMQKITVSEQLKQRVLDNAKGLRRPMENRSAAKPRLRVSRHRALQAIAACLVLMLAIGGATTIAPTSFPFATPENSSGRTSAATNGSALGGYSLPGGRCGPMLQLRTRSFLQMKTTRFYFLEPLKRGSFPRTCTSNTGTTLGAFSQSTPTTSLPFPSA